MLSPLKDYQDLASFLSSYFTKSKIKQFFTKKELSSKIDAKKAIAIDINLRNFLQINPDYNGPMLEIIYEDDTFIVVEKPPYLHTHPLTYQDNTTVLNFLRKHKIFAPLLVNTDHYERGLLYRLDYVTSGILVLVKSDLYNYLRQNYHILMEKYYLAVIQGKITEGELTTFLSPKKTKMKPSKDGLLAKTEIKVLTTKNDLSLVRLKLITGWRHQLRAQLGSVNHPILGDTLYNGIPAKRVYLHAFKYIIKTKEPYEFKSKALDDFKELFSDFDFEAL